MLSEKTSNHIQTLFNSARAQDGREYIYTLLRVTGPEVDRSDSVVRLQKALSDASSQGDVQAEYRNLVENEDVLELLCNLLNCAKGNPFSTVPFHYLDKGSFPQIVRAGLNDKIEEVCRLAADFRPEFSDVMTEVYGTYLSTGHDKVDTEQFKAALSSCRSFLKALLVTYFSERLSFKDWNKFQKVSAFEVMELLMNDQYGLYGFKMHFPTGSHALFERHPDSHDGRNFFVPDVSFFVGLIDAMQSAWSIEGKRLHELNLPGRYNKLGEWKPIAGPTAIQTLSSEARSLSDDPDVQGAAFYILSTGFCVIEFVAVLNVDLPHEQVSFGDRLHLWKCPPLEKSPDSNVNVRIYDGWLQLDSFDINEVRHSIAMIEVALNRLAFAYDGTLTWRGKYRLELDAPPLWTPQEEDTHLVNSLLKDFPKSEDAIILDAALDWYRRARTSRNPFTAFLCYYIALESVSIAVADGEADFGLNYHRDNKLERRQARLACIQNKHEKLYQSDPQEFVEQAYFDCVVGLGKKTKRVVELVFGTGHANLDLLFTRTEDGHSLSSIRSMLAHGKFVLLDRDERNLVRRRLPEVAHIAKELLIRLTFFLKPDDPLPAWSQKFSNTLIFDDPRSTMFVNDEALLRNKDWRIRLGWCD